MIIAVAYENGNVYNHFGKCGEFKIYNIIDNKIVSSEVKSTNNRFHSQIIEFLKENNVDALVVGGIGSGAKKFLDEANISLYSMVSGNADEAVISLLNNTLSYSTEYTHECHHH